MKQSSALLICLFLICINDLAAQNCGTVSVNTFPMNPQTGQFNYFGVRATIPQPYTQDITVTGTIQSDGHPTAIFTIVIPAGSLKSETATDFYQTDPGATASVNLESIYPCPAIDVTDPSYLYLTPHFIDFAKTFLSGYFNYTKIHNAVQSRRNAFIQAISNSNGEETSVAAVYGNYGLDFENAMNYKNQMDNSFLKLLIDFPTLIDMDTAETWRKVISALDLGMKSSDADWVSIQNTTLQNGEQLAGVGSISHNSVLNRPALSISIIHPFIRPYRLTIDEVWDCLVDAVGLGTKGILSIAAIQALAKEGIHHVVLTVSKWLAKKLGWFGAIVTVLDFSNCVYSEARD